MVIEPVFPLVLLNKSNYERGDYFTSKCTTLHRNLSQALDSLKEASISSTRKSLISVVGPTGVGKSTLIKVFEHQYKKIINLEEYEGFPIVSLVVKVPDKRGFNWNEFYCEIMEKVREPLIDNKIEYFETISKDEHGDTIIQLHSKRGYRQAMCKALLNNRVSIVLLDEAHHLGLVSSSQVLRKQLEIVKSLGNENPQTKFVLFGTYDLLPMLDTSDQLITRKINIHFPRYSKESDRDIEEFIGVFSHFLKHIPLNKQLDLVDDWEYYYDRTLGCIGLLHDWLLNALKLTLLNNSKSATLNKEIIKRTALSLDEVSELAKIIAAGERYFEEKTTANQINNTLNFRPEVTENTKIKKSNRRVGERNPKRDVVGIGP